MRISVIIPVKDDPPIFDCVASVLASHARPEELDVIVVDNGSAPAFRAQLAGLGPGVRVLDEPRPGAAAARNRGIDASEGDYLLFTDADCVVRPGWVGAAVEGLERTGADVLRGAEGGALATTPGGRLIQASFAPRRKWQAGQRVRVDSKNMAVRRHVFDRVRFNPESLRAEDTEFGRHAEASGFRVAFWPAMCADHHHEERLEVFLAKRMAGGWVSQRVTAGLPDRRRRPLAVLPSHIPTRFLRGLAARMLVSTMLGGGRLLTRIERVVPARLGGRLASGLAGLSFSTGGFLYLAGFGQPHWRTLLDGSFARASR